MLPQTTRDTSLYQMCVCTRLGFSWKRKCGVWCPATSQSCCFNLKWLQVTRPAQQIMSEQLMTLLPTSTVAWGSWPCSHMKHHQLATHTQPSVTESLCTCTKLTCAYLWPHLWSQLQQLLVLPNANSWPAGLLAAVVCSNFQSIPPQRKRSLTLASLSSFPTALPTLAFCNGESHAVSSDACRL